MYHEETPNWIPFVRAFGEIAIDNKPTKLQARLTNRRFPGINLGPAEDLKGDTNFLDSHHKTRFQITFSIFLGTDICYLS
jgi:hypothetical protein